MKADKSRIIMLATAILCVAVIAAGAHFGLKASHPSGTGSYLMSASDRPTRVSQAAPDRTDTIVYVTNTGACYHRDTCIYLRRSKIPMALSEAKKQYRPCSKCNPPR
jgi:hypothetical protein